MVQNHTTYMQRCIELAEKGIGNVAPNPLVGAVLVYDDKIIGEGWHREYGKAHAEVNCIASVEQQHKDLIPQSTLYVSLEPCNHHGKTPPCSDLILQHNIKKVVVGSVDPNPLVAGSGIEKLRLARVEVITGVLEKECDELNKRFFTFHRKKRPYILLKVAQSVDGFMAPEEDKTLWLSNDLSKRLAHKMRAHEHAIMVGTKTALIDNPSLTTRLWSGKNPTRVLIDKDLKVPADAKIFSKDALCIVINTLLEKQVENITYLKADFSKELPQQITELLYNKNIQSLIIEGGAYTINEFIAADLWDEACIITTPLRLVNGKRTPNFDGTLTKSFALLEDKVEVWRRKE